MGSFSEDARGAELADLARLRDERIDLAVAPGAVHEPDVQLPAGRDDRLAGLDEVRDVVERVVEPEDVDPVLGRACHEPAHDVGRDRASSRRGTGRAARARAASSCARRSPGSAPRGSRRPSAPPRRRRRRPRPRGRRTRRRRGSPRRAAPRPSGRARRAAPATGAGSWCRRAAARGRDLTACSAPVPPALTAADVERLARTRRSRGTVS